MGKLMLNSINYSGSGGVLMLNENNYSDNNAPAIPYDLLNLCKQKVLLGTPTIPQINRNRISIENGGYVIEDNVAYIYIEGTQLYANWAPAADTYRSMAVLLFPTVATGDMQNPSSNIFYNETQEYLSTFVVYNHSSENTYGQICVPKGKGIYINDKIIMYGIYLAA